MPSINQKLLDQVLRFQIDLRRLEAGIKRKVIEELEGLQKKLIAEISSGEVRTYSKARTRELLASISPILAEHYKDAEDVLQDELDGLAKVQVNQAKKSLETTVFIESAVTLPTDTIIDRVSRDVLINGGPLNEWWSKQRRDVQFKLSSAIREGVLLNETNDRIISKIIGRGNEPGILPIARNNAAAIVQTATHQVANDARQAVYERNDDIIKAYVHFSTLDSRTSVICIGRSGLKWKNNKDKTPIGHKIPFQVPPLHFNCRSVILPETLTFKELGVDLPEPEIGERASSLGPISADSTFADYLDRLPKSQQDKMLGKGRAQLWRDGKISLGQLLDGKGRELTLVQLNDLVK